MRVGNFCRSYCEAERKWKWARPAPVSQKMGGSGTAEGKTARKKVLSSFQCHQHPHLLISDNVFEAEMLCPLTLWQSKVGSESLNMAHPQFLDINATHSHCLVERGQAEVARCLLIRIECFVTAFRPRAGSEGVPVQAVQWGAAAANLYSLRPPLLQALY